GAGPGGGRGGGGGGAAPKGKAARPRRGGAGRAGGRAARPALGEPGVLRLALEPLVSQSQRSQRELGHEDSAGLLEFAGDRGLHLDLLVLVWLGAPRRLVARVGDQVLRAPRHPWQRPPLPP